MLNEKSSLQNSELMIPKGDRKAKLEALIRSHSKQNQQKIDFLNDSVHKKERKNTFG